MAITWIKIDEAESWFDPEQSVMITADQVAAVENTTAIQKAIGAGKIQTATEQEYDDYIASLPVVPVLRDLGKVATFDQDFAYESGQLVLEEGILYAANSDIVAGIAFAEGVDANEWTAVQVKSDSVIADKDTTTTTVATSYADMANMTRTPTQAGTYLVMFSATISNTNASTAITVGIHNGTSIVAASERYQDMSAEPDAVTSVHTMAIVNLDGATPVKVQWKVSAGTGTVYQRQMLVTRIA